MTKDNINKLLLIRTAVAILGEDEGWWKTKFFTDSSKTFLKFSFPRSKNVQYAAAFDAIKHSIDQKIGPNHFHLFRLSVYYEEKLHNELMNGEFDEYLNRDNSLSILKQIARGLVVDSSQGPKNIGNINDLNEDLIQAIAAEYLSAFESNYIVSPYLN